MSGPTLRSLLEDGLVIAPGAHDALSARLVEEAGFSAAFLSGATLSATRLGRPDLGFLSATDVVDATSLIVASSPLPLVVDADTGWGNAVHVTESVRRLEAAGAAAIVLEDQVAPKRCGAMTGKAVVGPDEMRQRIAAATATRRRALIVARTDAAGLHGLADATRRAATYADAGADLVFTSGVAGIDDLAAIRAVTGDAGLVVNLSESATPTAGWPDIERYTEAGVQLAIVPVLALLAAVAASRHALGELRTRGTAALRDPAEWTDFNVLLGLPDLLRTEQRWAAAPHADTGAGRE